MKRYRTGVLPRKKVIAAIATAIYISAILGVIVIGSIEQRIRSVGDAEHIAVSYMSLGNTADSPVRISFDALKSDIEQLKEDGYISILPKYYIAMEVDEKQGSSKTAMLLFGYENAEKTERILNLLYEYGFCGVFIVDTQEIEELDCEALIEAIRNGNADICLRADAEDINAVEAVTAMNTSDSIYRAAEKLSYAGMISSIRFGIRPISCMRSGGEIETAAELVESCGYSVLVYYGEGETVKIGQTVVVCCKIRTNSETL